MTILPRPTNGPEVGIVIRAERPSLRPTICWAYLWASDDPESETLRRDVHAHTRSS